MTNATISASDAREEWEALDLPLVRGRLVPD